VHGAQRAHSTAKQLALEMMIDCTATLTLL
jgi:hypothetical protein